MLRALAFLLALSAQAPGDPAAPLRATVEGRRLLAFVDALNAGMPAALQAFVESGFSAPARQRTADAERVERLTAMSRELAPLTIVAAPLTTETARRCGRPEMSWSPSSGWEMERTGRASTVTVASRLKLVASVVRARTLYTPLSDGSYVWNV